MSTYPDLYLPHTIKVAQTSLPPVPASPREPLKPSTLQPQRFSVGWLSALGIGTIIFSLISQSLAVFFLGLMATIAFGLYSSFTYPKRLAGYEDELRQYERNRQQYLLNKRNYDREVKIIRSEDNIRKHRLQTLVQVLQNLNPDAPDGQKSNAQIGSSEGYFRGYLTRYFLNRVKTGLTLKIINFDYPYTPDFAYMNGSLYIDIELDEPYVYKTKQPCHYLGSSKQYSGQN